MGVTKIVLLWLKVYHLPPASSVHEDAYSTKACSVFHTILSITRTTADLTWGSNFVHLSRLRRSKVGFHQALDLILKLDEAAIRCTRDILRQSDYLDRLSKIPWVVPTFVVIEGEINMVIKDLYLEPKVDAMMRLLPLILLPCHTCDDLCFDSNEEEVVPKVDDVSLVDGDFDGAFGGEGEEYVVMGEGVVVTSLLLEILTYSCLGEIMVSFIFFEGLKEEA
ncbi:hypothetical protein Tco_0157737 [Tanacetum coccineum]